MSSSPYFTAFSRSGAPQLEDVLFARWLLSPESPWASITTHQRNSLEDVVYGGFYFDSTNFESNRLWWLNFLCVSRMVREVPAIVATWAHLVAKGIEPCLAFVATLNIRLTQEGLYHINSTPSDNDHHMPYETRSQLIDKARIVRNLRTQKPAKGFRVWDAWICGSPSGQSLWADIPPPKTPAVERKSLTGSGSRQYTLDEIIHHLLNNVEI
jgi:hypothetical protein